jgi:hypothetical protein
MRMKLGLSAVAFAMLVGCGRNSGFLRDANTANEHQFRMELAAQRYSRSVAGSSSIRSILCLIPMSNGAYKDAMASLHAQARLQTNEVLENIREDHAFLSYLVYCEDSLIISADVYDVVPARVPAEARRIDGGACDPPYSIDSQGRELFKLECLPSDPLEPSDTSKGPPTRHVPSPSVRPAPDAGGPLE